ncbi:MAG: VWA domain-containing protein [Alphaproteobacteria bacterium]|nr:VWA domain-containing protein [Alphaproteobacteria bacterium]
MSFLWPSMLWLLVLPPLLVLMYLWVLRRKKREALRYANLAMVRQSIGRGSRLRRHAPPLLMLAAFVALLLGMARPEAYMTLPSRTSDVVMAMDISGSMRAGDIEPTRIEASKIAAKNFIKMQPRDVKIGITAFAGSALLVQAPTIDRDALATVIDRMELQRGTAIGSAILVSLKTIFPQAQIDISMMSPQERAMAQRGGVALGQQTPGAPEPKPHTPVLPGSYENAIIVVLTDGNTNTGVDPIQAARLAADYGVKVFTVGFGAQPSGGVAEFAGQRQRSMLNEEALRQVAEITRGAYFHASTAEELTEVYATLNREFFVETKKTEVTAFFAALATALTFASVALSMMWFSRVF